MSLGAIKSNKIVCSNILCKLSYIQDVTQLSNARKHQASNNIDSLNVLILNWTIICEPLMFHSAAVASKIYFVIELQTLTQ